MTETKNVSLLFYIILNQAFPHDSQVSLHSWLLWPTVRRYDIVLVVRSRFLSMGEQRAIAQWANLSNFCSEMSEIMESSGFLRRPKMLVY